MTNKMLHLVLFCFVPLYDLQTLWCYTNASLLLLFSVRLIEFIAVLKLLQISLWLVESRACFLVSVSLFCVAITDSDFSSDISCPWIFFYYFLNYYYYYYYYLGFMLYYMYHY